MTLEFLAQLEREWHEESNQGVGRTYPPPPMPATARAAMRVFIDGANPQHIVPEPVLMFEFKMGALHN